MYSEKFDEPIHSGRADWLSADPEPGISPPQSNGQALESVSDRIGWGNAHGQSLSLQTADAGSELACIRAYFYIL